MAPVRVSKKQKHLLRIRGGGDTGNEDGEQAKRRRKRHYYNYTVKQKISIVQEAYSKPNTRYVALSLHRLVKIESLRMHGT
jgi:hypothetical protein